MNKAFAPLAAAALLALGAAPASADGPAGGCPVGYTLTAISDIPPQGQAGAIAIDQRGNNDGYVCLMPFPNPNHPGQPFNGIDNRVQAP
jgi:hypothetical protein